MDSATVDKMSKKRGAPEPGPQRQDAARKPMVVQIRGSEEYKEWAERLARFDSLSLAALFDRAVRRYAREIGFKEEPPER